MIRSPLSLLFSRPLQLPHLLLIGLVFQIMLLIFEQWKREREQGLLCIVFSCCHADFVPPRNSASCLLIDTMTEHCFGLVKNKLCSLLIHLQFITAQTPLPLAPLLQGWVNADIAWIQTLPFWVDLWGFGALQQLGLLMSPYDGVCLQQTLGWACGTQG